MTATGKLRIPADPVPRLRVGIRRHMLVGLGTMIVLAELPQVDLAIYAPAEERYTQAAEVLKLIGFNDRPDQADVTLPLAPWAYLILWALDTQRAIGERRLERAAEEGLPRLSRAHVGALGQLADELRHRIGMAPRGVALPSFLQGKVKCRRLPRGGRRPRGRQAGAGAPRRTGQVSAPPSTARRWPITPSRLPQARAGEGSRGAPCEAARSSTRRGRKPEVRSTRSNLIPRVRVRRALTGSLRSSQVRQCRIALSHNARIPSQSTRPHALRALNWEQERSPRARIACRSLRSDQATWRDRW